MLGFIRRFFVDATRFGNLDEYEELLDSNSLHAHTVVAFDPQLSSDERENLTAEMSQCVLHSTAEWHGDCLLISRHVEPWCMNDRGLLELLTGRPQAACEIEMQFEDDFSHNLRSIFLFLQRKFAASPDMTVEYAWYLGTKNAHLLTAPLYQNKGALNKILPPCRYERKNTVE